jgi:hypothetical protein
MKAFLSSPLASIASFLSLTIEGNNLFHWKVLFSDFDDDSHLRQELVNYTCHLGDFNTDYETGRVIPMPVEMEIKFLCDFPKQAPLFRFVKPKFEETNVEDLFEKTLDEKTYVTSLLGLTISRKEAHEIPNINFDLVEKNPLSFSRQLEKSVKWKAVKVISFLRKLRANLMNSTTLKIDLKADKNGLPTMVRRIWS